MKPSTALKTRFANLASNQYMLCMAISFLLSAGCHMAQNGYPSNSNNLIVCGSQRLSNESLEAAGKKAIDVLELASALIDIRQAEIYNAQSALHGFSQDERERDKLGARFVETFFNISVEASHKCLLENLADSTSFVSFNLKADEVLYFGYARYEGKDLSRYLVTVAAQL